MIADLARVARVITKDSGLIMIKASEIEPFQCVKLKRNGEFNGYTFTIEYSKEKKQTTVDKCEHLPILQFATTELSITSNSINFIPYHDDQRVLSENVFNKFPGFQATYLKEFTY